MSKLAKHQSIPKELKSFIAKIEKMPEVFKIVLGMTESCRHSFTPGSAKVLKETMGGIKVKGYFGGGVINIFLVCEDRKAVKAALTGVEPPKKRKSKKPNTKRKKTYTIVRQDWEEKLKRVLPDGYSLHLSAADRKTFVKAYLDSSDAFNKEHGLCVADAGSRPLGPGYWVDVPDEVYREVKKSKNGVRRWHKY